MNNKNTVRLLSILALCLQGNILAVTYSQAAREKQQTGATKVVAPVSQQVVEIPVKAEVVEEEMIEFVPQFSQEELRDKELAQTINTLKSKIKLAGEGDDLIDFTPYVAQIEKISRDAQGKFVEEVNDLWKTLGNEVVDLYIDIDASEGAMEYNVFNAMSDIAMKETIENCQNFLALGAGIESVFDGYFFRNIDKINADIVEADRFLEEEIEKNNEYLILKNKNVLKSMDKQLKEKLGNAIFQFLTGQSLRVDSRGEVLAVPTIGGQQEIFSVRLYIDTMRAYLEETYFDYQTLSFTDVDDIERLENMLNTLNNTLQILKDFIKKMAVGDNSYYSELLPKNEVGTLSVMGDIEKVDIAAIDKLMEMFTNDIKTLGKIDKNTYKSGEEVDFHSAQQSRTWKDFFKGLLRLR